MAKHLRRPAFLLAALLAGLAPAWAQYQAEWARTMGGHMRDEAQVAIETSDRGLLIGGFTQGEVMVDSVPGSGAAASGRGFPYAQTGQAAETVKYPWLVKLAPNGYRIWGRLLANDTTFAQINALVETPDKKILAVGTVVSRTSFDNNLWLALLDGNGTTLWEKNIGGRFTQKGLAAVDDGAGGFLVVGSNENNADMKDQFWFVSLDASGNILWEQQYGTSGVDVAECVARTPDGGFVAGGYALDEDNVKLMQLIKVDGQGMYQWRQMYQSYGTPAGGANLNISDGIRDVAVLDDGDLALVGYTLAEGVNSNYDVRVMLTDPQGQPRWDQRFGSYESEEGVGIAPTYDGGLAVLGQTTALRQYEDFWLLKLTRLGDKVFDKTFGGGNYDLAKGILQTYDNGLLAYGSSFVGHNAGWDYALLKLIPAGFSEEDLPVIGLVSPNDRDASTEEPSYTIEFCLSANEPVTQVSIWCQDTVYVDSAQIVRTDPPEPGCEAKVSLVVPLSQGRNRFSVQAKNIAGVRIEEFEVFYMLMLRPNW